jgi:hypothetical protein
MKKLGPAGLLLFLLVLPQQVASQEFGVGARVGFLGLGGEAALGITDALVVRGGFGVFPFEIKDEVEDVRYTITPPSSVATIGVDLYPGGGFFRFMGGVMIRTGDWELQSDDLANSGVEIGDGTYNEAGTLSGILETSSAAPFLGIGFGRHTSPGFGITVDLGVAYSSEASIEFEADGPIRNVPGFLEDLEREEQNFNDEAGGAIKFWPIVSVGIKIPVG